MNFIYSQSLRIVTVCDFGRLGNRYKAATKRWISQRECLSKDICTEALFMKYKEQIQATTTINEFSRCHTNPSNQNENLRTSARRTFFYGLIF